jgi:aminoglycoside phosphotransferase (APT) family kinase protein
MEKLPGQRLSDSLDLPQETLRSIARELGDHLSRIHTIRPENLGEAAAFFASDTDDTLATVPQFLHFAAEAGLDVPALERALRRVERVLAQPRADRLTHNDFRACHAMVHEGRLSGLIDFGQVSVDTPINDLAKWEFWEAPAIPAAWLAEGYGDKRLLDDGYAERFRVYRLTNALWVLRWYALTGYAAGAERAAGRIAGYLAEMG